MIKPQILMPPLLLYSVNCYFKFYLQEKYRGNRHYVWVSESFDSGPPTANPKAIYISLKLAVAEEDEHDYKITEQKSLITARAVRWEADGEISSADKDEIVFSAMNGAFKQWRPLIYVIPYTLVAGRVEPVPRASRAGLSPEYRIADLERSEFDIIEP
jgi:hypothetical protein